MPGYGCGIVNYCGVVPFTGNPNPTSTNPPSNKTTILSTNTRTTNSSVIVVPPNQNKIQYFAAAP